MLSAQGKGGINMKPYPIKYKRVRDCRKTRCINPHCGKWVELYQEKICPRCGKRSIVRSDKEFCDDCHVRLHPGDPVCPLCGSKQRFVVELRSLKQANLTACAHLLHKALPAMSLEECRKQCRSITSENPFRVSFAGKPEQIRPFIREWNELQGTAVPCLNYETSRRPTVLIHSYNRKCTIEHARLLLDASRKSNHPSMTFEEAVTILHDIIRTGKPYSLNFVQDFDQIESWVAVWKSLGGTAVRSMRHA